MESVDSFLQGSLFEDTFTPVTTSPLTLSPSSSRSPKAPDGEGTLPDYKVIRSSRRTRSISAYRQNGVIEIHIPARLSKKDERALIPEMIKSVLAREARKRSSDSELFELAGQLLTEYLPEFHERPKAITWRVMRERWGSCTTSEGTIRISTRLNGVPEYALEYVLFHELIHLRFDDHGVAFNAHLERFPRKAEAEAFLEGFEAGLACPSELN